ncbi:MAG TPA: DUF2891 domain-containing protein [Casimicrobiaceae bacterium]|nr:DUF2891 domain-containing protein [Casimicrobiaceae bacterium]
MRLTEAIASQFARRALDNVEREFPNKLDHVMSGPGDVQSPRALHPVFYGSFDWHSCVHMHWLLARIARVAPAIPERDAIARCFDAHFVPEAVAAEVAYLERGEAQTFERTYGWAWLLKLAEELGRGDAPEFTRWTRCLAPLASAFVDRYLSWLPLASYPLRTGLHANSAFGLAFALDYARSAGVPELASACETKARAWYGSDRDYPAAWEPSGSDFFSPALVEADLMRRVLPGDAFAQWMTRFLPALDRGAPATLFTPAAVSDRSDGLIVHLDGLNLSRAWSLRSIASALPSSDFRARLDESAQAHLAAGLEGVESGDYAGAHWLATYATLALTGA